MYEIISESLNIGSSQFNRGERGIKVGREFPVYARILLPAENNKFGGQSRAVVEIFPKPSNSVQIHFELPEANFSTYSNENAEKAEKMRAGLDSLCEQAEKWIDTFVLHLVPGER
jgi:hypothetical protein